MTQVEKVSSGLRFIKPDSTRHAGLLFVNISYHAARSISVTSSVDSGVRGHVIMNLSRGVQINSK